MISVCIPVYNNYVDELVAALVSQVEKLPVACEILLYDDGSAEKVVLSNKRLTANKYVQQVEGETNSGRIEARKRLAALAQYNWLLFIDADSQIIHENFLLTYCSQCTETVDVLVGGRIYSSEKPASCQKVLHWKYGSYREKQVPGRFIFMTNNFCIRKKMFQQIDFPHTLNGYGHEDTWMGIQLQKSSATIVFIKNPVQHAGIEDASIFIKKSEAALKNVAALQQLVPQKDLKEFIKLYRYYLLQRSLHLTWLLIIIDSLFHKTILKNLHSCHPRLGLFDFYRLVFFIRLQRKSSVEKHVIKMD